MRHRLKKRSVRSSILILSAVLICGTSRAEEPAADLSNLIVKPDAFKTLVNPQCSHCRDEAKRRAGELRESDRTLCWIRGYSDGGGIPIRFFLSSYRVISDSYGVFVYDPDAGFARGFAPSYDFAFDGWRNGVMVMKEKEGTRYSCLTGIAFDGPKKGAKLKAIPTLVSDWGFWLERYPQAVAFHMFDKYQPVEVPETPHPDSILSRGKPDERLPTGALVLGVSEGKQERAYPLDSLEKAGLIAETVDGQPWVVLYYAPTRTAAAYLSLAAPVAKDKETPPKPRSVTLLVDKDKKTAAAPFVDKETGSHWDITGRAVVGELKGQMLTWLDGTQCKWFAWVAEYPHTTIYGK
jgi:hypothetical protein